MPYTPPVTSGFHPGKVSVKRTSGNLTPGASTSAFTAVSSTLDLTLPAVAGDLILVGVNLRLESGPQTYLDMATMVSGSPVNWVGATGASGDFGMAGWLVEASTATGRAGSVPYIVQAGDISGGNVTFRLFYRTGSAVGPTFDGTSGLPLIVHAQNFGQ